jgi:hypothetical protein
MIRLGKSLRIHAYREREREQNAQRLASRVLFVVASGFT